MYLGTSAADHSPLPLPPAIDLASSGLGPAESSANLSIRYRKVSVCGVRSMTSFIHCFMPFRPSFGSKQVLLHAEVLVVRDPDTLSELSVSILRIACRIFSEEFWTNIFSRPLPGENAPFHPKQKRMNLRSRNYFGRWSANIPS
jgi:hypothetical protein